MTIDAYVLRRHTADKDFIINLVEGVESLEQLVKPDDLGPVTLVVFYHNLPLGNHQLLDGIRKCLEGAYKPLFTGGIVVGFSPSEQHFIKFAQDTLCEYYMCVEGSVKRNGVVN